MYTNRWCWSSISKIKPSVDLFSKQFQSWEIRLVWGDNWPGCIQNLLGILLKLFGKAKLKGLYEEFGWKMTSEGKVDLIQPWINLLWVIQFHPNFQDNSYPDRKIIIWSLEDVTSLISLPWPFFSKFALACKRHTLFFINFQPP